MAWSSPTTMRRWVTLKALLWSWVLRIPWYVRMTPRSSAVYRPNGPISSSCGPPKGHPPSINLYLSPFTHQPLATQPADFRNAHRTPHSLCTTFRRPTRGLKFKRETMLFAWHSHKASCLLFTHLNWLDYWANFVFKAQELNKKGCGFFFFFFSKLCFFLLPSLVNAKCICFAGVHIIFVKFLHDFVYWSGMINWISTPTVMIFWVIYGIVNIYVFLFWFFWSLIVSSCKYLRDHLTKGAGLTQSICVCQWSAEELLCSAALGPERKSV